jgi:tetratricopeptide (TPR) repeat protein
MKEINFSKICNYLVLAMAGLLPIVFFPWSPLSLGADNYGKIFIFGLLVLFLFFAYSFSAMRSGKISFRPSPLDKPLLIFLGLMLVSSLFGANRLNSFFGNLDAFVLPYFFLLFLALFYFFVFQTFNSLEKQAKVLKALYFSFAAVVVFSFLVSYFYLSHALSAYLRLAVGNAEDLSVYLVLFLAFSMFVYGGVWEKRIIGSGYFKKISVFISFLALATLLRIDFRAAWWLLALSMGLLLWRRHQEARLASPASTPVSEKKNILKHGHPYLVPVLLLLIAINFLLNSYLVSGQAGIEKRLAPYRQQDVPASTSLLKPFLAKDPILGAGLDNFDYVFSLNRPASANTAEFWDLRYAQPANLFFYVFYAGGILGVFAFLYLLYSLFRPVFASIKLKTEPSETATLANIYALTLLLMLAGFFLYTANANLLFLFFLFSALFLALSPENANTDSAATDQIELAFLADKNKKFYAYGLISLSLFFALLYLLFSSKYYLADASYGRSSRDGSSWERSAQLSPYRYQYNLGLARYYNEQSVALIQEKRIDEAAALQNKALENLGKLEKIAKNSVLAQESAAVIYRDLSEGGDGFAHLSQKAFERALALEPSNPVLKTELAQVLLRLQETARAEAYFREVIASKPEYRQAELGLAKALGQQGKYDEAKEILGRLSKESGDPEAYYELGLLYFNNGKTKEAITAFSAALTISPLHSNSLYGLATAYEKSGDKQQALFHFKKLQKMNPNNLEINRKVEELQ